MSFEAMLLAYAAAVGFTAAGIAGTFYQLVTARPPAFPTLRGDAFQVIGAWFACAITGPFIIGRMLLAGWRGREPLTWSVAGIVIVGLWSGCTGIILLQFAVALSRSVA